MKLVLKKTQVMETAIFVYTNCFIYDNSLFTEPMTFLEAKPYAA